MPFRSVFDPLAVYGDCGEESPHLTDTTLAEQRVVRLCLHEVTQAVLEVPAYRGQRGVYDGVSETEQ